MVPNLHLSTKALKSRKTSKCSYPEKCTTLLDFYWDFTRLTGTDTPAGFDGRLCSLRVWVRVITVAAKAKKTEVETCATSAFHTKKFTAFCSTHEITSFEDSCVFQKVHGSTVRNRHEVVAEFAVVRNQRLQCATFHSTPKENTLF